MLQALVPFVLDSSLNRLIVAAYWTWPVLEILHFIGLSLLLGGLLVIDLRLAGHFRMFTPAATHQLLPLVLIGFALNLVTGILFFYGDPVTYANSAAFQLKMVLIVVAGLNALLYYWKLHALVHSWTAETISTPLAKVVAWTSLGIWAAVLLCGRLIPYIGTYSGAGN